MISDRTKIVGLLTSMGTLIKETLQYVYTGDLRLKFSPSGEVIQVAQKYPSRGWKILSEEQYDKR